MTAALIHRDSGLWCLLAVLPLFITACVVVHRSWPTTPTEEP